jgi:tripartite-type tricarboxylate transporter receptor subunit TctC
MIGRKTRLGALLASFAMSASLLGSTGAQAQDYPDKPINFVVCCAAGGFADSVGRIIAQGLSSRLGQPIVVENVGGGSGNIAAARIANADADGYNILVTTTGIVLSQSIYSNLEYKLAEDLVPIVIPASSPEVLAVHPSVPASNLEEFIAWGKQQKEVSYSSAGVGSGSGITIDYVVKHLTGLNGVHVAYSGGGPANQAAIQGEVQAVGSSNSVYPFIREGLLKGIAIASEEEHHALPGVKTYAEQGFPGFTSSSWVGLFAPDGTDPKIVQRINDEVNAMLDDPATVELLKKAGVALHKRNVDETAAFVKAESESWANMVKTVGVKVE